MDNYSVQRILGSGVLINPHEAVAIVQQLLLRSAWDDAAENAPAIEHVLLCADGKVQCQDCRLPSVVDAGRLLDAMLPAGRGLPMPGALRFTVARACQNVDAPPFATLAGLSAALERFEQGDRREVVRQLVARAITTEPTVPVQEPRVDRRRRTISEARLRREIRDVDRRLFALREHGQPAARPASPRSSTANTTRFRRARASATIAAVPLAFGAGYAGVVMHQHLVSARHAAVGMMTPSEPTLARAIPLDKSTGGDNGDRAAAGERESLSGVVPIPVGTSGLARAITESGGPQFSPAFAPDGTAIYFHTGRSSDPSSALMMKNAVGAHAAVTRIVDDGSRNYHVQPSPDGRQLAFDSDRDGERGVYLANSDGTNAQRISGAGYAAVPSWAPTGHQLAFIRAEARHPSVWNLWLLSLDTGEMRRLTNYTFGQTWSASWFSDGTHICYAHEDKLVVLNVHTQRKREYTTPLKGHIVRTPAVSPGGEHVVFQVYRVGVWLLDLKSGSMRQVLDDRTAEEFAWSPDGRHVAFHSRRGGAWQIWTMSVEPSSW